MELSKWSVAGAFLMAMLTPALLLAWSAADRDFDGDGTIGFGDFLMFAKAYGTEQTEYDLSGNGDVDFADFLMFVQYYGKTVAETEIQDTITVTLPSLTVVDETMQFIYIPGGRFTMGQPYPPGGETITEGLGVAWPDHEVTISKGFYLGRHEVTQGQWEVVMGTTPWYGQTYQRGRDVITVPEDPKYPSPYVSWNDAQAFITMLNQKAGRLDLYRLPTEAQWEYACRAGTTTQWFIGDWDDEAKLVLYAWYVANTNNVQQKYAHKVGTRMPNPWGLHDMHGNVSEWCQDEYESYSESAQVDPVGTVSGANRVHRGGSFSDSEAGLRSWVRYHAGPEYRDVEIGFRVVMRAQ